MAMIDTDKQKYTKNLAPLEFSGSKKEFSSCNITCLVVNEFNLKYWYNIFAYDRFLQEHAD